MIMSQDAELTYFPRRDQNSMMAALTSSLHITATREYCAVFQFLK